MKLKITVIEGNENINVSAWGSESGNVGGFAKLGAEFIVEGNKCSMSASDPIPDVTDQGLGGGSGD